MFARYATDWIRRQAFDPTLAGMLVNPFYLARRGIANAVRDLAKQCPGKLLDVGCGRKPYKKFFEAPEYIGVEVDTAENRLSKNADVYYNGRDLPFEDAEFDVVLCSQVLEHVFEPNSFLGEINRVLRVGGKLLLTTPFVWDEHEQPVDYGRYSSFGLKHLLTQNGFEIEVARKTSPNTSVLFQLFNAYLYKITWTRYRPVNLLSTVVLMAPFNLLGAIAGSILPRNEDLYLDNVILARKVADAKRTFP